VVAVVGCCQSDTLGMLAVAAITELTTYMLHGIPVNISHSNLLLLLQFSKPIFSRLQHVIPGLREGN